MIYPANSPRRRELIAGLGALAVTPNVVFAATKNVVTAASPSLATAEINMKDLTISEKIMHATLRIICPTDATHASVGTGFIFGFPAQPGRYFPAIITNKHVVAGFSSCYFTFTGMNADGTADLLKHHTVQIADLRGSWIPHPDPDVDLALIPLAEILEKLKQQGTPAYYSILDETLIPTDDLLKTLEPLEELVTVGYPEGLIDDTNNLPIFHRGSAATAPYIDYQGRADFLIDIATWPGSSGSPVFLYNEGTVFDPRKNIVSLGQRVMLLGIIYKDYEKNTSGKIEVENIPSQSSGGIRNPINIGLCIKAKRILGFDPLFEKFRH